MGSLATLESNVWSSHEHPSFSPSFRWIVNSTDCIATGRSVLPDGRRYPIPRIASLCECHGRRRWSSVARVMADIGSVPRDRCPGDLVAGAAMWIPTWTAGAGSVGAWGDIGCGCCGEPVCWCCGEPKLGRNGRGRAAAARAPSEPDDGELPSSLACQLPGPRTSMAGLPGGLQSM